MTEREKQIDDLNRNRERIKELLAEKSDAEEQDQIGFLFKHL